MNVERGMRRVTWAMSAALGFAAAVVFVWLTLTAKGIAHSRLEWQWLLLIYAPGVGVIVGALPWGVFFLGWWIVSGFKSDL
jgi:hypothetical protein